MGSSEWVSLLDKIFWLYLAKYCCPALDELDPSVERPDKILQKTIDDLVQVITDATELKSNRGFQQRMIKFLHKNQKELLIDFWNKAKECYNAFTGSKRLD